MKTKTTPRDPALAAARNFFRADAELAALNEASKNAFPGELSPEDHKRWADAYRRRESAQLALAFETPTSTEGALEALRVAVARLDALHPIIREAPGGSSISSIVRQARKALRSIEAGRERVRQAPAAPSPRPVPQAKASATLAAPSRPQLSIRREAALAH